MTDLQLIATGIGLNMGLILGCLLQILKLNRRLKAGRTISKINMIYKMATYYEDLHGNRADRWKYEQEQKIT